MKERYYMKTKILAILALGVFLLCFGFNVNGQENAEVKINAKEHILKNGMKVLILERHNSPTVACYIYFRVGSIHEPTGQSGIAHLLEHLLFKGTHTIGTTNYQKELE